MSDNIQGIWRDSAGNENRVSIKASWGKHCFSREEIEALLRGEEISFEYRGKRITGHLQYFSYKGSEHIGFEPDFDSQYDKNPVFKGSTFRSDMQKEDVMAEFMRLNYYERLTNDDGTPIIYRKITEKGEQLAGVDVEFIQNGEHYLVDEKAQLDYIHKKEPLPTFALEIMGVKGAEGWFVKDGLKTRHYLFIWPHAADGPLTVDKIEYAMCALVEKKTLQAAVNQRYGTKEKLTEYARDLMAGRIGYEKDNRAYYKDAPFDQDGYLVYTKKPVSGQEGKEEEPVNLVVRRRFIESLALSCETVRPWRQEGSGEKRRDAADYHM